MRKKLVGGTAAFALIGLAVGFWVQRSQLDGGIYPRVWVGELELSRLSGEAAGTALTELEDTLLTTPATFLVDGTPVVLSPASVGFNVDMEAAVAAAQLAGRERSLVGEAWRWLVRDGDHLELTSTLNQESLDRVLSEWETEYVQSPPFDGQILVERGEIKTELPRSGMGIDRTQASRLITQTLSQSARDLPVELPLVEIPSRLNATDLAEAEVAARGLLAGPITLSHTNPEVSMTLVPAEMGRALRSQAQIEPEPRIELALQQSYLESLIAPLRNQLEAPPVDASFEIGEDDSVKVLPGRKGTLLDAAELGAAAFQASQRPSRTGVIPISEGADPELTTEEAAGLGVKAKVSEFTTYHSCCQPRVSNIHLIADLVDGALVLPGETFSLNQHVGPRTEEGGFVMAPMVLEGELVDAVGGGVSQFATTFYNAVFFGGYEDVEHHPHSYYFSRYPEGREATISWPEPNLIFRNDSEAAVLIKTSYTDTSITVKFFGDNGGRIIQADKSERTDFKPPPTKYVGNPALLPGEQKSSQTGGDGWALKVFRTITLRDGTSTRQEWPVRYRPFPNVIEVHPCQLPDATEACPPVETLPPETIPTP